MSTIASVRSPSCARAAALPVREALPQPLAVERVLPEQHDLDEAVDEMRPHHLGRAEAVALAAVVGGDGQQRLGDAMRLAGMRVAVAVLHLARHVREDADPDIDDFHAMDTPISLIRQGIGVGRLAFLK